MLYYWQNKTEDQSDKATTQIGYFFTVLSFFFSPQISKYLIAALQRKFYFIIFSGAKISCPPLCKESHSYS